MKDISKPTNTICKEIINHFKTTNDKHIAISWGSGCIAFFKLEEKNKTKFYVGLTEDWLGRHKKYSKVFNENTSPNVLFKFCNVSYLFLFHIKNGEKIKELQTSNFCEAIRENMNNSHMSKYLINNFKF